MKLEDLTERDRVELARASRTLAVRLAARPAVADELGMIVLPFAIGASLPRERARLVLEHMRREGLAAPDDHEVWRLTALGRELAAGSAANVAASIFRSGVENGWKLGDMFRRGVERAVRGGRRD